MDDHGGEVLSKRTDVHADRISRLEEEVKMWSPASSAFWALWGIVQAEEQIRGLMEGRQDPPDFDYLVSLLRIGFNLIPSNMHWRDLKCLEWKQPSWE